MNRYIPGQVAAVTFTFTDTTGNPVDPTGVTFRFAVTAPDGVQGATTTYTWNGSTADPGIGVIGRTGVGVYQVWLDTTGLAGVVRYETVTSGTGQTAGDGTLIVEADPLS